MANSDDSIPVTSTRTLPPDPRLMKTIGLNHAFETAIADLVDNSIDAGAEQVLVRFMREGDRLLSLYVADDGRGMTDDEIDRAMTIGDQRSYSPTDLGHFGIGLKAASLGQAASMTVLSRANDSAVGRRWLVDKATEGFECDVVDPDFARTTLDRDWQLFRLKSGTVVRWDGVKSFPSSSQTDVIERYLEDTVLRVRQHLGLVFHRLLEKARVVIGVDVEDVTLGETGAPFLVEPINPFGYMKTGHGRYPRTLCVDLQGASVQLHCHIWPGRSKLAGFRLQGGSPEGHQGFYFYRHDRLLQAGGWNGVVHPESHYQLARVAIDIGDADTRLFAMNPEKTRVEPGPGFAPAIEKASKVGFTLGSYLDDARTVFKESRKRTRERPRVVPPGTGFGDVVRRAIGRELDFLPGEEPIQVRWCSFWDDSFFEVDREEQVIWLNKEYRSAVLGGQDGSLNDAPLVKALLYLLVEDLFRGAYLGAKDRDNIELWQAILTAAAKAERQ